MSSYLTKLIVIFAIAAIGAGVHLASAWPVKLKAAPEAPPIWVPPAAGGTTNPTPEAENSDETEGAAGEDASEPSADTEDESEPASAPDAASGAPFVLDTLEITLEQAQWLFENQMASFVDARPADRYEAGHIADALHIAPAMLEANSSLFALDVIDPALPIVIYCDGGDCDDSHRVAELLQQLRGFEQTHVFADGYGAWEAAGLPTADGPDPFAE